MDTNQDWRATLQQLGVVRRGHFRLHSGLHSDTYIYKKVLFKYPDELFEICLKFQQDYSTDVFDVVVGPESGGAKFAEMLTLFLNGTFLDKEIICLFCQKSADGTRYEFNDYPVGDLRQDLSGKQVLIVDDVLTTGDTILKVMETVRQHGGIPNTVFVIWDRSTEPPNLSIPLIPLIREQFSLWEPDDCPMCGRNVPLEIV